MLKGVPKIFSSKKRSRSGSSASHTIDSREQTYLHPIPEINNLNMSEEDVVVPVPPPVLMSPEHQESRLHEHFSEDGRQTHQFVDVDDRVRDSPVLPVRHVHDYPEFDDDLGGSRSVLSDALAKPASSGGRSNSNQRVTFIGGLDSTAGVGRQDSRYSAVSSASKYSQGTDATEHGYRHEQYEPQRHIQRKRLPYMILADFGNGLEIGNEIDGFMPYEEYSEYKATYGVDQDTYYIIPGNSPVVFHDEEGNELFRVDAHKYKIRRHKFIIQDEFGQELHRIGDSRFMAAGGSSAGSDSSRPSRSKTPKLIHLGGGRERIRSPAPGSPRSDRTGSDIYIEDEYGRSMKSRSSDRDFSRGSSRHHGRNDSTNRSNYMFVDEYGRPVNQEEYHRSQHGYNGRSSDSASMSPRSRQKLQRAPIVYL